MPASLSGFICPAHNEIPGAGTDSVSEVQYKHFKWFSWGKIKFLKWLLLKSFSFLFFFWCAHKRKDLQVQEEHSSILLSLLKGELCSQLSQYSIPVAYEARARWKGGVPPHGDPTQTSAWQRPRPFHWDKTQARSVRYHYKWFLCLIGNSCCALLPAGRCWKSVGLRVKLKVGLDVSTHPAFSRLTSALINLYPLHPALATDCKKAWK